MMPMVSRATAGSARTPTRQSAATVGRMAVVHPSSATPSACSPCSTRRELRRATGPPRCLASVVARDPLPRAAPPAVGRGGDGNRAREQTRANQSARGAYGLVPSAASLVWPLASLAPSEREASPHRASARGRLRQPYTSSRGKSKQPPIAARRPRAPGARPAGRVESRLWSARPSQRELIRFGAPPRTLRCASGQSRDPASRWGRIGWCHGRE